jgi:serine/threonine protein phosphatase 1
MRTFVIGDIHGNHKALIQCLERSGFDKEKDQLIQLGDVADGWPEVYECVEELLSIKNLIPIIGNHDSWFRDWFIHGVHSSHWLQGGHGTLESYCRNTDSLYCGTDHGGYKTTLNNLVIPKEHMNFWLNQQLYYIDHENRFFVHGGFDRDKYVDDLKHSDSTNFYWDRKLWNQARSCKGKLKLKTKNKFKEIFIGHTATELDYPDLEPVEFGGVWNLDQGAGWSGKLTIMNVDTKEYWQSDIVTTLYPKHHGRN